MCRPPRSLAHRHGGLLRLVLLLPRGNLPAPRIRRNGQQPTNQIDVPQPFMPQSNWCSLPVVSRLTPATCNRLVCLSVQHMCAGGGRAHAPHPACPGSPASSQFSAYRVHWRDPLWWVDAVVCSCAAVDVKCIKYHCRCNVYKICVW